MRILDVFHATEYLNVVMQALGWDEDERQAQRASWYRGDINARVWLHHHLPDPSLWCAWSEPERRALRYLEERLHQMDYFNFKQLGYPIGSAVIEGAASSVIAARMRRAGMRWSCAGHSLASIVWLPYALSSLPLNPFSILMMSDF